VGQQPADPASVFGGDDRDAAEDAVQANIVAAGYGR